VLDRTDGSRSVSFTLVAPPAEPAYVDAARQEVQAEALGADRVEVRRFHIPLVDSSWAYRLDSRRWEVCMKTLATTVSAASLALVPDVVYAGGPGWKILGIPINFWILLIVILLIVNLVCCWRKR
jgi:hypothetical protein